jgi:hypothetical protein
MSYDLKAFCRDLQDRLNWLFKEVVRLQEENDRLLKQNMELREEATLSRLFSEMEESEAQRVRAEARPETTARSFHARRRSSSTRLPASFNFADFFQAADAHGLTAAVARDWMLLFLREKLIEQRGHMMEKVDLRSCRSTRQLVDDIRRGVSHIRTPAIEETVRVSSTCFSKGSRALTGRDSGP